MSTSCSLQPCFTAEKYPVDADCYAPTGEDRELCHQMLSDLSFSLFHISAGGTRVLWISRCDHRSSCLSPESGPQHRVLSNVDIEGDGLDKFLTTTTWKHMIFVIKPSFSWGQLSITELAFRRLLARLQVFTPFLRVVHTFGTKTNDKERSKDIEYYYEQQDQKGNFVTEFCYNIRYFEPSGRGKGNPWSLRQTGVYHRQMPRQQSTWILLNYSERIFNRFEKSLNPGGRSPAALCAASSLCPHLFIISAASRYWNQYTEDTRRRVKIFEDKAYRSRIDAHFPETYELPFSDMQKIIEITDALDLARKVLLGQQNVLSRCLYLHNSIIGTQLEKCTCEIITAIRILNTDLKAYDEALTTMVQATSRVYQMLSAIFTTRAHSHLHGTVTTLELKVSDVQNQSSRIQDSTVRLLQSATHSQRDAVTVKILAQTATLFLPPSLVAALFSSTVLIPASSIASPVGLYFAITIPLLITTIALLLFLEKGNLWGARRHEQLIGI